MATVTTWVRLTRQMAQAGLTCLAQELKTFLLGKTKITRDAKREAVEWDACHLAVCKDNGCDVFLTCDYASIWAYRRFLKRLFAIEVRRPVELLKEIRLNC